ncbi:MAG: precorrin-6y C5,15-methyltransferase (decarboxylating) subunit CbiE [Clostridia bacterium]|nr:precorrin-6y C5,15-methyltransferase (decarboxylating) subunit CbiE [Clostridia bacterium]
MSKFYVVGIGPGHPDYLLPKARKLIDGADVIIGGKRNIESIGIGQQTCVYITADLSLIKEYIDAHRTQKRIVMIVSGDSGFYSMLSFVRRHYDEAAFEVVPGISSMQYMFSAIKQPWQDAFVGSVHGREADVAHLVLNNHLTGLLTDYKNTPAVIAESLKGQGTFRIYVGERLSYEDERITIGVPDEIAEKDFDTLSVVIVENMDWEV